MKISKKLKLISLFILIAILITGTILSSRESIQETNNLVFTNEFPEENRIFNKYIYLSGEINKPGTYKFNNEIRLSELIEKAGGFTENADMEFVNKDLNLSQKVLDEMKIFVPSKNSKQIASQSPTTSQININTATITELDTLPGIGESTAKKIIDGRTYKSIEDLKNVSGIGDSKFNQIKDLITV
jgi:competence protein ComEA